MTDRELLELAAKATGLNRRYYEDDLGFAGMIDDEPDGGLWNPLTDDGDALRLAADLALSVVYTIGYANPATASVMAGYEPLQHGAAPLAVERYVHRAGRLAATRRAIVRAAAQVGKDGA